MPCWVCLRQRGACCLVTAMSRWILLPRGDHNLEHNLINCFKTIAVFCWYLLSRWGDNQSLDTGYSYNTPVLRGGDILLGSCKQSAWKCSVSSGIFLPTRQLCSNSCFSRVRHLELSLNSQEVHSPLLDSLSEEFNVCDNSQYRYYAQQTGMVMQTPCLPRTYSSLHARSVFGVVKRIRDSDRLLASSPKCRDCPAGYECKFDATSTPVFCYPGMYRPANDTVACELCLQGTWSRDFSITAPEFCEPCPVSTDCADFNRLFVRNICNLFIS